MNELEKITVKYHRHLKEGAEEGMVYFTMEDVHKCMEEGLNGFLEYFERNGDFDGCDVSAAVSDYKKHIGVND